jgi:hypothetical protein
MAPPQPTKRKQLWKRSKGDLRFTSNWEIEVEPPLALCHRTQEPLTLGETFLAGEHEFVTHLDQSSAPPDELSVLCNLVVMDSHFRSPVQPRLASAYWAHPLLHPLPPKRGSSCRIKLLAANFGRCATRETLTMRAESTFGFRASKPRFRWPRPLAIPRHPGTNYRGTPAVSGAADARSRPAAPRIVLRPG